jgi:hypothetical protein
MNMNFERGWISKIVLAFSVALLGGCLLGPWNLTPQDQVAKVQLEVALMLVQGKPFDTLWIERPLTFANGYDSSVAFINSAASETRIIRTDVSPPETVLYRMSSIDTRAWLPDAGGRDTVRQGARYRLEASLDWDAAREFPRLHAMRMDSLTAETYVQRHYAVRDTAWAPLESLHPALSLGLPPDLVSRALADTAVLDHLYDSLEAIRSLSRMGVGTMELRQYLGGGLVMRPLAKGDTAFYIFDPTKVVDPDPANPDPIGRYSRQWRFIQDLDKRDFGGLSVGYAYDTTQARILDPLTQGLQGLFDGGKVDTAKLYQRGHTRFLGITGKADPGASGYPDTLAWGNRNLDYTGRDAIYFYAVDSLYVEYQRAFNPSFSISLGGDRGGNTRRAANNALHYSNIRGGDGYFSAAAVDSFVVHLVALKDTIPVPILHAASIERDKRRNQRGD